MGDEKELDREATIRNILKICGDDVDMDAFNKNCNSARGSEFIVDSALYWEAEIVYK